MKKIVAISLLGIHLIGNTELGQLLKLPRLISHFLEHQQADPGINLFDFLTMHYAGDDGTATDDDKDSQLPCHNLRQTTIALSYSPMTREAPTIDFPLGRHASYRVPLVAGIVSDYSSEILRPPRQA